MLNQLILDKIKAEQLHCPKINGEAEVVQSAVLVLLEKEGDRFSFILEKRVPHIRQGGEICFPGGIFDAEFDKSLQDTSIREACEELELSKDNFNVVCPLDIVVTAGGVMVHPYLAILEGTRFDKDRYNTEEVARLFKVPWDFFENTKPEIYEAAVKLHPLVKYADGREEVLFPAKELGLPELYWNTWGGSRQKIYLFRYDGEIIWGLTARIIYDLLKKSKVLEQGLI